ncbi:MAG: molybdate ABC transporter permease subunit [Kineosporiaceae bacterium]|nr:molybdate ABC transporter permease subunit [Kineosporiaceae bacterium]
MQIVVPSSNPAEITQLSDLAEPGVKVVLCQVEVPCGSTAAKVFTNAKLSGEAGLAGGRREVDPVEGHPGGGRRGARLRHGRPGRQRQEQGQGHRHRDPGRGQRLDQLPDRPVDQLEEPRPGLGVRRLRSVPGRRGGAHRRRLRAAVTRSVGTPRTPWPIAVPAALAVAFLLVPLLGMLLRAPWRDLPRILVETQAVDALRLSLICATSATAISLVLGVPLAWVLARSTAPGLRYLRALVTLPLVLPPVVGGVALLLAYGRLGVVGQYLDRWFGVTVPFTTAAVVLAETFVAMPFLIVSVEGALRSADAGLEEAAATLGARRFATFRRVTLPLILPSIAAGSVLCWARALGEFGATITFAGNLPGVTQAMPSAVYRAFETDPPAAIALSLVLLAVSVTVLVLLRDRWLRPGTTL